MGLLWLTVSCGTNSGAAGEVCSSLVSSGNEAACAGGGLVVSG